MSTQESIFEGRRMTQEETAAAEQALLKAVGGRNAVTVNKTLAWLRQHPRTAAGLLSITSPDQVEYAIRGKWGKRKAIQPDRETALAKAQELADRSRLHVEVYHRPAPDKFILGFKVEPKA